MRKEPQTSGGRRKPPRPPGVNIGTIELPEEDDKNVTIKRSLLLKMMKWVKDRDLLKKLKKIIK